MFMKEIFVLRKSITESGVLKVHCRNINNLNIILEVFGRNNRGFIFWVVTQKIKPLN